MIDRIYRKVEENLIQITIKRHLSEMNHKFIITATTYLFFIETIITPVIGVVQISGSFSQSHDHSTTTVRPTTIIRRRIGFKAVAKFASSDNIVRTAGIHI